MAYEIQLTQRPAEALAGMKISTGMSMAFTDCPKLWEAFGPHMGKIRFDGEMRSFGVSMTVDPNAHSFDYWAAMPLAKGTPVPAGLATLDLPGGLYAECFVESLGALGEAYQYVYGQWLPAQTRYRIDTARPCYEYYRADHMETNALWLYFPVAEA